MDRLQNTAKALEKNGFQVQVLQTAQEAKSAALELIGSGSVGIGGSMTIQELGLYETLLEQGNPVYWHWKAKPEDSIPAIFRAANTADTYLCSSNAILEGGALLNIDGNGNRVASMFWGPKQLIFIAGVNKLAGDFEDALARIKREACPPNAKRLGLSTPCGVIGKCTDCSHPKRMCNITMLLERPGGLLKNTHVLLVNEKLGC